jgi:hypothetical protein
MKCFDMADLLSTTCELDESDTPYSASQEMDFMKLTARSGLNGKRAVLEIERGR